jgi:serine/threonine-protein kinase HipA
LSYEPEAPTGSDDEKLAEAIQLAALDRNAARLNAEQSSTPSELLSLLQAGASAGGAKPKALLYLDDSTDAAFLLPGDGRSPWVVKFSSVPHTHKDSREEGRVEYAYALMASAAGIRMPESRLLEINTPKGKRALFAVRRFDRPVDGSRLHLHTLAGLRHIHHQAPGFSYEIIADTLLRITGDRRELRELARRAAFNILAGNRDDHAKNFSLLMDSSGQWSQSPAYDITPSPGPGRQGIHVAALNGSATPTKQDFLSFAKRAELDDAEEIFEKARDAVHNWPSFAKQAGLRDANIKKIACFHNSNGC